eukprot:3231346-Pyramimonas_sp.AAC.1
MMDHHIAFARRLLVAPALSRARPLRIGVDGSAGASIRSGGTKTAVQRAFRRSLQMQTWHLEASRADFGRKRFNVFVSCLAGADLSPRS